MPAFWRRILPEPVTRNRLEAPECVLFFGMSLLFLRWSDGARRPSWSGFDLWIEVLGALALLLRRWCCVRRAPLGVLLGALGLTSRGPLDLLGLHLGLGL